jgi:hypothetical protein
MGGIPNRVVVAGSARAGAPIHSSFKLRTGMRRLVWLALGLSLAGAGIYLAGRAPSEYVLERELARYHESRQRRFTLLAFHIAKAEKQLLPELHQQMEHFLRETRTVAIRGWEVVLVPAGARMPGQGYRLAARKDVSIPADPPQLKGPIEAWTKPVGRLAQLFASR